VREGVGGVAADDECSERADRGRLTVAGGCNSSGRKSSGRNSRAEGDDGWEEVHVAGGAVSSPAPGEAVGGADGAPPGEAFSPLAEATGVMMPAPVPGAPTEVATPISAFATAVLLGESPPPLLPPLSPAPAREGSLGTDKAKVGTAGDGAVACALLDGAAGGATWEDVSGLAEAGGLPGAPLWGVRAWRRARRRCWRR